MGVCFNKKKHDMIVKKQGKEKESDNQEKKDELSKKEMKNQVKEILKTDTGKLNSETFTKTKNNKENSGIISNVFVAKNSNFISDSKNEKDSFMNKNNESDLKKELDYNQVIKVPAGEEKRNVNKLNKFDENIKNNYKTNKKFNDTFDKLININSDESEILNQDEDKNFQMIKKEHEPLFNLVDLHVTSNSEYSTDNDWSCVLKKAKHQIKALLVVKLLNLKERRWNKENIMLSDIIKENRDNLDSYILTKYLNLRLKLQEHFNWLIWAISNYYYTLLFNEQNNFKGSFFVSDEFGLPSIESLDWLNGFEWKGIFIRVQTHEQSKYLFQEMKAFNYLFFEYIQLIDIYKFKTEDECRLNYLSNELIFPLISHATICSLILVGSVCINKYNYDANENAEKYSMFKQSERESNRVHNFNAGNYFTANNQDVKSINNPFVRYLPKVSPSGVNTLISESARNSFLKKEKASVKQLDNKNVNVYYSQKINPQHKNINNNDYFSERKSVSNAGNVLITDRSNGDISRIMNENNSIHSVNISHNINKDINLESFSKEDLAESFLLSRIQSKHLIKVIDDLNDNNYYNYYATEGNYNTTSCPKFKFMIISALDVIPNLVDYEKKYSFAFMEQDERKPLLLYDPEVMYNKLMNLQKENRESNLKPKLFNHMLDKILLNSEENSEKKQIANYEGDFSSIRFKIFYSDSTEINSKEEKNYRINDYFLNIYSRQINLGLSNNKLIGNYGLGKQAYLEKLLLDNKKIEIRGKSLVMCGLTSSIKLKYSLIKNNKSVKLEDFYNDFSNKSNFLKLVDKFSKLLDSNLAINDVNTLKEYLHRYGINSSLEIFLLPKIKNPKTSDLIKLDILCKMIKEMLNFHEGVNLLLKLNLMNINASANSLTYFKENLTILNDGHFDFIKEKSLFNIYKVKIFHTILSVLNADKSNKVFVDYFYENMNNVFFFKMVKWKLIDESIGFNLFSEEGKSHPNFTQENLFSELIQTARKRPFLFLNTLETHLHVIIDPLTKFKASIALEQFIAHFDESMINETEPKVNSYIKSGELSYYLFTKCIHTSRTSTKYDSFKNKFTLTNTLRNMNNDRKTYQPSFKSNLFNQMASKETKPTNNETNTLNQAKIITSHKNNLVYPPNSLRTKINLIAPDNQDSTYRLVDSNRKFMNDFSTGKISNNFKVNSNNITKINMINNRYVDVSKDKHTSNPQLKSDVSKSISIESKKVDPNKRSIIPEEDELLQLAKLWDNLSSDMDLNFPPILYKQSFKFDEKHSLKRSIGKYLKSHYSFNKIETIKDWKSSMEMLLSDIITVDSSESVLIQSYVLIFIHAFYIENDPSICREILYKIKEIMKTVLSYRLELLSVVNFIEGLITEKKNYIESEEFFSKSLIFSLFLYGDPRGRGNFGNNFMLFPLWKIARQTCILENHLTNESFKEMFHCQDYLFKILIEISGNGSLSANTNTTNYVNSMHRPELNYENNKKEMARKQRKLSFKVPKMISYKIDNDKVNMSEYALEEEINEDISFHQDDKNLHFSEKTFTQFNKFKYFPFPSISDVKTSYHSYFLSENFLSFLLKNMLNYSHSNNLFDEDMLNKIGLNCYSIMSNMDISIKNNIPTGSSFKSSRSRRDKAAIFSPFMYEYLMDKMSFKKNPPNGSLLSWGNNSHNETSHNNYDYLSLPRVCYKLKDEEVVKLSCGWEHNLIVTNDKRSFTWGRNESGQCGIGEIPVVFNPTLIESLENVTEVSCGNEHSLALLQDGRVYSWGKAEDGVLGYMEKEIEYHPKEITTLKKVIAISSGSIHNMALLEDGTVYSWGCSKGGQLGHPESFLISLKDFTGYLTTPALISALQHTKISKVSCGEAHSLALTDDGKVYGWGFTSNGQLGLGICEDSFEPGQGMMRCRILKPTVIDMNSTKIIDVQCGKTFSCFISEKHELLVCGVNDLNQLGIEQPTSVDHIYQQENAYYNRCCDVVFPTLIECFLNMKVKKVACGESHCLALVEDMSNTTVSLWSWGSNRFGQLGQGNQIKKSLPKPINYLLGYTNSQVEEISCGAFHSLCVIGNKNIDKNQTEKEIHLTIKSFSSKWELAS